MKVSYDARPQHRASWDAASSVILDIAVTNKGVILKNYFCFLYRLAGIERVYLQPEIRSGADKEPDDDEELCSDHYHDIISTSESTDVCGPGLQRGRVSEYSESYHNLTNGNNNTHRVGVRTLRVMMLPGTGSDEMGSVIPGPAPVTYLTSSSRPEVLGINT